ncbi:helix-turn-helix domain-containing protein [Mycobacterium koreense]|uniref:Helix-turn-helix domain-containing protein n=1 Tax=Mycolicibacillus koreensis TaxID=1069220 RepID=A0A7I7SK90_9MYCO|nr:helix-turn-helix domain-containing protein [Mycolicibacillus koreensis]MCV7247487.1 helix-turn-helix domain-containing protein [Mycolicibacillus koreensis]OSC27598.1 hypothetical protein B8W67_18045 [Mycolicibacillus koreensis]BBY56689.1 hypothetical protein MKOR_39400 [Mycolicibacillus koreensis]
MNNEPELKRYNNDREVAAFLDLSVATLRRWRVEGTGPKFHRMGAKIVYPRECVLEFLGKPVSSLAEADARRSAK